MIQSMTGYGIASNSSENYKVTVELKSLNSKFIELNMKVPRSHMGNEVALRNILTKRLKRGKVSVLMSVDILNPDVQTLPINRKLVKKYADDLHALKDELNLEHGPQMEFLFTLPDAMLSDDGTTDEEEWKLIEKSFIEAAEKLVNSRTGEGKALEKDILTSADEIEKNLAEVINLMPVRAETIRERLRTSLEDVKNNFEVDQNRFEQEMIYYLEKLDLNEEVVRLKKHIQYFRSTVAEPKSNGKRLGFISQEMGREINTIGSKANNADIQVFVVRMKEELEKIKEQVLNIL